MEATQTNGRRIAADLAGKRRFALFLSATLFLLAGLIYLTVFWMDEPAWLHPLNDTFHVAGFFVLTCLTLESMRRARSLGICVSTWRRTCAVVAFAYICLGAAIEAAQYRTSRDADVIDLALDAVGVAAAAVVFIKRTPPRDGNAPDEN